MPSSGPSHPDDVPGAFGSDVQDLPFAEATKYGSSRMDLQSSAGSRQTPPLSNSGAPAQLPDCSTIDRLRRLKPVEPLPELVLVSTADGQVTAVDGSGRVVWRTDTGRPLLQASLKKISRDDGRGGSATYIPSLDGSLYKFDGKQIEVVATADSVMYSSVKTDPWVLTGGRETKTLGIDPRTGQIR
ncbi:eukaryotic translation initiation factor 2-alpha kinase-like [Tropilaelaps mercedesae]|uniref:Eukaryotic translation initiation factor 2-alpha kinase-like n=1 Tax=Tropilaelaps mercedesae TaxID=418985 RepID=A0A1V9X4F7_9ACAR|nr:eukaryotic translation initiation factor 2-alpha kinase-like [Tropilaelaps mercedesae]